MNAEIAKLRFLPTPRLLAAGILAICIATGAGLFIAAPTHASSYVNASSVALEFAGSLPIIVLGVWIVAVEFASGTLQRTLTAQSNRSKVLVAKLSLVVLVALVLCVAAAATSGGLADLASSRAGVTVDRGDLARAMFGTVPTGVATVVVGFAFALLTRSMGGGIALAAAFVFVLDGLLGFVPGVGHLTFDSLTQDLSNHISDVGQTHHSAGVAILGIVVWLLVLLIPGWLLFVRGDLK
ncbi:ABC-2 family transporter [Jatrophihabitans sp. GAS493]|uniref:ABC transporter permease subunit n=1 Tax=Jatrophihabitans sp. GAS493 TaxID=1907575 RepID=UPI000BB8D193|nr:ABC transporter permease subunit [Jatrophihabitans sp. GAS493]SOD73400.1 ABC-2 family transporter [Jatrophihabitans sp. GAS493]